MKKHLLLLLLVSVVVATASAQQQLQVMEKHRWHTSTFSNVAFGNSWMSGASFTSLSAPVGMQVTRQLNKNLYAFGRLSVAPTYFNFNGEFNNPVLNKTTIGPSVFGPGNFSIFPRAEAGLFYVNDEKTFSVSGSMFIERNNNFYYPANIMNNNTIRSFR